MTVRLVIALDMPDNDHLFQPIEDTDGEIIEPATPETVAEEFRQYASGFHITADSRYWLLAVENL